MAYLYKKEIELAKVGNSAHTVQCGEDLVDVRKVLYTKIDFVDDYELEKFEVRYNGPYSKKLPVGLDSGMAEKIENLLNKYWYEIGLLLPAPKPDNFNPGKEWAYAKKKQAEFSIGQFAPDGDAEIIWHFHVDFGEQMGLNGIYHAFGKTSAKLSLKKDVMPVLKKLSMCTVAEKTKGKKLLECLDLLVDVVLLLWGSGGSGGHDDHCDTPVEMPEEIRKVYNSYMEIVAPFNERIEKRENFMKSHSGKRALVVVLGGLKNNIYFEDECGFDIFEKEKEINEALNKMPWRRANEETAAPKTTENNGEKSVEYALKWIIAASDDSIVEIVGDCESKYRTDCILLCKPSFMDEPQEYDHILVCSGGIILIETKDWKGKVEIRPDGKWLRNKAEGESAVGINSPKFQMRRHEVLVQKILPTVPVHSLLCFSNPSTVVEGKEYFQDYAIVTIDQLEETILSICETGTYSKEEIEKMAEEINAHKVRKQ